MTLSDPSLFSDRCFVGESWVSAVGGATIEVENPATGESLGSVPNCGRTETDQAIGTAARALRPWSCRTATECVALLERWLDLVLQTSDDLC
jgi:succinate-semialdehyde dehydrogenase/glutarate-semialdehyde dehydrogenase